MGKTYRRVWKEYIFYRYKGRRYKLSISARKILLEKALSRGWAPLETFILREPLDRP